MVRAADQAYAVDGGLFMLPIVETPAPQASSCATGFSPARCPLHPCRARRLSIQKQSCFGILYHPLESLLQVQTCHRTARHDVPFMRLDRVETQSLCPGYHWPDNKTQHPGQRSPTSRTSSSVMAPGTSLLFLKTSRLAPERRLVG
jgi:hypothetical protein